MATSFGGIFDIEAKQERLEEVNLELENPELWNDPERATKISKELGCRPSVTFEQGLSKTIDWFLENTQWLENVTYGNYQEYYNKQYN